MCRIPRCINLSSSPEHIVGNLCLYHAIFIDDIIEDIYEYNYTNEKILDMIIALSINFKKQEMLYMINKTDFISACSYWEIIYKSIQKGLFKLKDYQDRLIIEEIILELINKGINVYSYESKKYITDDIYNDFIKKCEIKFVY